MIHRSSTLAAALLVSLAAPRAFAQSAAPVAPSTPAETTAPAAVAAPAAPVAATTAAATTAAAPASTRPYDLVVIVSFDGMRADAVARADAPNLHMMQREGATALDATTIHNSSTLPSHSSMLSGVEQAGHGMDFDDFHPERGFIRAPTVFTVAHDAGLATAMFVSKTKLRHIAVPGSLDVWSLPHWSCERVSAAAAHYLADAPAGVTFIHFSEPDDAGHMRRWMSARYLAAIHRADACFGTVFDALRARADRGRVLVIATADHGGHRRGHGTLDPHDLHIPWIAWGGRVAHGAFRAPVRTVDTAATALAALGLAPPATVAGHGVAQALTGGARTRVAQRRAGAGAGAVHTGVVARGSTPRGAEPR